MSDIALAAKKRGVIGKKVKNLRRAGLVPAVIHNHGSNSLPVEVDVLEFVKVYSIAGKHHPVKLDVDGKKYTTLIKEVTHYPASNKLTHAVFQSIKANEKVLAEVPLQISEDNPATRAGLLVLTHINSIEIEALPGDLIDVVEVDTSSLNNVGDKIIVADLTLPKNIEVKIDSDMVIASVEMPKDQIAEADAAIAEGAEQAEQSSAEDQDSTVDPKESDE